MRSRPLPLSAIVDALDCADECLTQFLDVRSGEVFVVPEDAGADLLADIVGEKRLRLARGDERDLPALDDIQPERFRRLPSQLELEEVHVLRDFARSHPSDDERRQLLDATYGRGLYRRFRETVQRLGLRDAWQAYRTRWLAACAREWLQEEELPFVDDLPR